MNPREAWWPEELAAGEACVECHGPLDDTRPWQRGFDGGGVHLECLELAHPDDEERDRD